jgi:hypothetical protein
MMDCYVNLQIHLCSICFIVKYFRRNHFSKKNIFFSKIFFSVWLARKNQRQKTKSGNIRSPLLDSRQISIIWLDSGCMVGIWLIWPDSDRFNQILAGLRLYWPKSGKCCQIPAIGYQNLEPSAIDLSYQQTQIPGNCEFPQTCIQK